MSIFDYTRDPLRMSKTYEGSITTHRSEPTLKISTTDSLLKIDWLCLQLFLFSEHFMQTFQGQEHC